MHLTTNASMDDDASCAGRFGWNERVDSVDGWCLTNGEACQEVGGKRGIVFGLRDT
jgi:hypothetical protein